MPSNFGFIRTLGTSGSGNTNINNTYELCINYDLNHLAIADYGNSRLLVWKLDGTYYGKLTKYGITDTTATPHSICYIEGNYYFTDPLQHVVVCVDAVNLTWKSIFGTIGTSGSSTSTLNSPYGMCAAGKYLYVVDTGNDRVMKLDSNLTYKGDSGTLLSGTAMVGITYDPTHKELYIVDNGNDRVMHVNYRLNDLIQTIGSSSNLSDPCGCAYIDQLLYVADYDTNGIVVFETAGASKVTSSLGSGDGAITRAYDVIPYRNTILISQYAGDEIMQWYNYSYRRGLTSSTTRKFEDDTPHGKNPMTLIAGTELIAGTTQEYGSPNRWIEEEETIEAHMWTKET